MTANNLTLSNQNTINENNNRHSILNSETSKAAEIDKKIYNFHEPIQDRFMRSYNLSKLRIGILGHL